MQAAAPDVSCSGSSGAHARLVWLPPSFNSSASGGLQTVQTCSACRLSPAVPLQALQRLVHIAGRLCANKQFNDKVSPINVSNMHCKLYQRCCTNTRMSKRENASYKTVSCCRYLNRVALLTVTLVECFLGHLHQPLSLKMGDVLVMQGRCIPDATISAVRVLQ